MSTTLLKVFDTTLRDGEQGIGNVMTLEQKKQVLMILDTIGLDIIELGFPAASPEDFEWFRIAKDLPLQNKKAQFCAFSRLHPDDLKITVEALEGYTHPQVQLLGTGSEIHLQYKRKISLDQSLEELRKAVAYLKDHGIDDIALIIEDATRGSLELLEKTILVAMYAGVSSITLPDTVGFATPSYITTLVQWARKLVGNKITLGIHCHNDLGLATANTLAAIQAGADLVQTTIGGIGERCGNCALEEVASVLHYKKSDYPVHTTLDLNIVAQACHQLFSVLEQKIPNNKPLVGRYVFSTAAGIHQNGIIKNPEVYEYVKAKDFGRSLSFIFNRLSGHSGLKQVLQENGITNTDHLKSFYQYLIKNYKNVEFHEIADLYNKYMRHVINQESYSPQFFAHKSEMPQTVEITPHSRNKVNSPK